MEFFDSHAHYNDEKYDNDRNEILNDIYNFGITKIVCNGYNLLSSEQAAKLAQKYDYIYSTIGISPNDIDDCEIEEIDKLKELYYKYDKIVAVGEIGLDYYWSKESSDKQKQFFMKQIDLADELDLPITIHCRDAIMDTLNILKNYKTPKKKGIFHCCMLNKELIKEALKLGFYISFSGNVTFKNAKYFDAINEVPIDKILIETDSPYLTPVPYRGQRNDSRNVKYVAEKIAEVKNIDMTQIAKYTYNNAKSIYNISC